MKSFSKVLERLSDFKEIKLQVKKENFPLALFGLTYISRILFASELTKGGKKGLIILPTEAEVLKAKEDLSGLGLNVITFPSRDYSMRTAVRSLEFEQARIGTLSNLLDGAFDMLLTTPEAAVGRTITRDMLESLRFTLSVGQTVSIEELKERLVGSGYTRCETVDGAGQFAIRGSIVDIYSPNFQNPCRLDFWGDEIDTISFFDASSQRRTDTADSVIIIPAAESAIFDKGDLAVKIKKKLSDGKITDKRREVLADDYDLLTSDLTPPPDRYLSEIYGKFETVLDYFEGMTFICDVTRLNDAVLGISKLEYDDFEELSAEGLVDKDSELFHISKEALYQKLSEMNTIVMESMPRTLSEFSFKGVYNFVVKQISPAATVASIIEEIPKNRGHLTLIMAGEKRTAESLAASLEDLGITAAVVDGEPTAKTGVFISTGTLSAGLEIPYANFTLIAYGRAKVMPKKARFKRGGDIGSLSELKKGDAVVHSVHGIGIFDGIVTMNDGGVSSDYIKIKYRGNGVLYVPITSLDLVSRYVGVGEEGNIKLNKLGSSEWSNTKKRVRAAVKDIAKQLTKLYAERMKVQGFAFSPDCDMQRDFEARFPYDETADQLRSIDEIKADMQRPIPMDRLLCGDVGFGKTEVALRAAFKAIAGGKQCAILVPTTILAWQHYTTAIERFSGIAVNVEMLSRFRTPTSQNKIKKRLREGNIDLIIGTHKLFSSDVDFKDLGLLIIDEEQRFGVAQKEKLKEKYPAVDVLTLSATPIPRTLNMALSGLRDMSSIEEAPHDRMPVQTYVMEHNNSVVFEAISKELGRGGQVYYLHNRVDSITSVAIGLQHRFPEASVGVAHGKMGEEELSTVWKKLLEGEIDILVCTTIIETGVDVPNVNTLIIEDADHFGLSQLHQLRGRVGRSHRRAYAYFLFKKGKVLSDISGKRLEAIREFTEFGSGYKIAMRDLELRGAGSVLGASQHGHMESVGYDMYLKLLGDAIAEEKGDFNKKPEKCTIGIHSSARIPESYIADLSSRIEMYRRIAGIRSEEDLLDVTDELIDRFGDPPKAVAELAKISLIKARCINLGLCEISERGKQLVLFSEAPNPDLLLCLYAKYSISLSNIEDDNPSIAIDIPKEKTTLKFLEEILDAFEDFQKKAVKD